MAFLKRFATSTLRRLAGSSQSLCRNYLRSTSAQSYLRKFVTCAFLLHAKCLKIWQPGGVLTQPLRLLARATTRKTPWLVCSVQDLDDYQKLHLLFFLIGLGLCK